MCLTVDCAHILPNILKIQGSLQATFIGLIFSCEVSLQLALFSEGKKRDKAKQP